MNLKSEIAKLKKQIFPPKKMEVKVVFDEADVLDVDSAIWVLIHI